MKNQSKKTKLAKSLHDFAVLDAKVLAQRKCTLNVPYELTANNLTDQYITVNSSLKEINAALFEAGTLNYTRFVALNAFRAKYSELYNIYSCNIEDEIENMLIVTCDLSHDLNGDECTPIKAIQSYIAYGVKNDENICTPIRKENERYITGIKALNKEVKKTNKETAKKEAKKVVKFYSLNRAEKIQVKTAEFIQLGCDESTALKMATNFVDNLK